MQNTEDLLIETYSTRAASLRIAVVTETFPPEVNGVAMTLGKLVDGLLQRGHAVQMVRPRQSSDSTQTARSGLEEVLSRGLPLPAYDELRFGLPAKGRLLKLWQDNRPDLVHVVTEGPLGWSAVAAARKLHLPITSSFHTNFDSYSQHYGLGLLKGPIETYLRKLHNRTHATMVPTRALADNLRAKGYHNVKLLARGVDTVQFSPTKRSAALRESWGAGPNDTVTLLVGRLAKEKNMDLAVAAFRAMQAQSPGTKMVFVGDGPLRQSLQADCPQAIFAGVRRGEDLAAHYASSDVFLFPSLTETFGNVVPEAMASGLVVLAYDTAAAKELIVDAHNGCVVPPGNADAFVRVATKLASSVALRKSLRETAAPSVAHLSWEAIYSLFVRHLVDVLAQQGRVFSVDPAAQATPRLASASKAAQGEWAYPTPSP